MLIKLIRPQDIPNRKADWSWKVRFFRWVLVRLLPLYKKCAISDTIHIGETQIIHNVRDYWYEQELQRFHIDTAQHLEKQAKPYVLKRKYRHSALFNWSESLLVFHNGQSYNIKHSESLSFETELEGQLKVSTDKDFIYRSEFTAVAAKVQKVINTEKRVSPVIADNRPKPIEQPSKPKISVKDNIPTIPQTPQQTKIVKYKGFEENDIF